MKNYNSIRPVRALRLIPDVASHVRMSIQGNFVVMTMRAFDPNLLIGKHRNYRTMIPLKKLPRKIRIELLDYLMGELGAGLTAGYKVLLPIKILESVVNGVKFK